MSLDFDCGQQKQMKGTKVLSFFLCFLRCLLFKLPSHSSVPHAHAVEERAAADGVGVGVSRRPRLAGDIALQEREGLRLRQVDGTLQDVGAVGDAAPAERHARRK